MRVDGFCIYCGKEQLETAYWYRENTYFVRCKNCKATSPSIAHSEQEAIELFNTRHDGPEQGGWRYERHAEIPLHHQHH